MEFKWKARYTDEVLVSRVNLCKVPDCTGVAGYYTTSGATGTNTRTIGNAKYGVYSIARSVTSTAAALVVWDPATLTLPVTVGTQYTLSAYVISSTSRTARVNLEWRDAGGAVISTSNGATVTTSAAADTYVRPFVTATAPANSVTVRIQFEITNAVNGDTHYWSAILLEAAATAKNYFDGNRFVAESPPIYVTKVAWNGTDFFSTSTEYAYTWYTISNIQELDFTKGRRRQIDDYPIDTGELRIGPIPSWSPAPKVGNRILFYFDYVGLLSNQTEFQTMWGRITDVKIDYGMVANEDRATITVDGIQADWGRAQLNGTVIAQNLTDEQALIISSAAGMTIGQSNGRSTGAALTWTGNAFDALSLVTRTEEARFYAALSNGSATYDNPVLYWYGRDKISTSYQIYYGDGTTAAPPIGTALKFDRIVFRSAAEEYYNTVTISSQPGTVANQTASTGATPQLALVSETNDYNATQALAHAQYLLNNYGNQTASIREISCTDREQATDNLNMVLAMGSINTNLTIGFRSTVYYGIVEGVRVTAMPGETRVTLMISPADNNAYLILDNAVYGKLDLNRLSF